MKKGKEEGESELWGSCEVPRYALPSLLPFPPPRTARRRKSKDYPFRGKNRGQKWVHFPFLQTVGLGNIISGVQTAVGFFKAPFLTSSLISSPFLLS